MNNKKEVYTLANAHLDTIWSWDFETTVGKYIYRTMTDNFKLFEKYPDYRFNFEGAYRYELMEEYYPELFEKVKKYVAEGRWNVCGSAYENGDVNVPSPEALFRNILYGNGYFNKTFSKESNDIFLPDCFGFGYALPTIARHSGLKGFSTQKLAWGSAYGVPFDLGKWYGVDGQFVYASLNTHSYTHTLSKIRKWQVITDKLAENAKYGLAMTAVYHGTGDRGGAPKSRGVKVLEKEMQENNNSDILVYSSSPSELFDAMDSLDVSVKEKLPSWDNELVMSTHAVGSYVSRAISKRWNRRSEELADTAERSAVCAYILGRDYPQKVFEKSWKRIIRHQFHDDLTGTSVQRAYKRVWNDYALSINELIQEYESSAKYISSFMDSSWVKGTAILINNPCEYDRTDIIEIEGKFDADSYILKDKDGKIYPCQKLDNSLIAIVDTKSLSYTIFDLSSGQTDNVSSLKVSEKAIENSFLKASINDDGYVYEILDKKSNKQLLKSPIVLAIYNYNGSKEWPAWEIPNDEALEGASYPQLVKSEILESGPVRASIKLDYEYNRSKFSCIISLTENGQILTFENEILWQELAKIAKQEFSLNADNEFATFDLGLGAIKRTNRTEKLYEVPAQKWADLSDGNVNVSIISDSKYSWDKKDNNTLRLTVLHTPKKNYRIDSMQSMMDLGLNRYAFAVYSHENDDLLRTNRLAKDFHQRMPAFIISKHEGKLGNEFSFGKIVGNNVLLRAMKKAENDDSIILRFNEINNNENAKCAFSFETNIKSASECLANERAISDAFLEKNMLIFKIDKYAVKTFSVIPQRFKEDSVTSSAIDFEGNQDAYSANDSVKKDLLPKIGLSLPSELLSDYLTSFGCSYALAADKKVLIAKGGSISLPEGTKKVYLLCGALSNDKKVIINDKEFKINSISERYAGWDLYDYKETAFIKDGRLGLEFTHCHSQNGDEIAKSLLFWIVEVDINDAKLHLPDDDDILILSIIADSSAAECKLATELFEKVEKRPFTFEMDEEQMKQYKEYKKRSNMNDKGRYYSTYNK